jgi:hypothetical protein
MADIKVKKTPNRRAKPIGKTDSVAKPHNSGRVRKTRQVATKTTLNNYGVK